ncbi:MAG: helix-turn-helix domain-containing protein [Micromonosporaceae bacterium]
MAERDVRRVTDVESMKAVAHPLRVRLLGALRIEGPATASELGRRFGESSGATSYHLRQLARYGFIEEDPEQPNARDRRWRAAHRYTSWRESDFASQPEGREATRALRARQREYITQVAERFEDDDWGPEWLDAAGQNDDVVRLTPDSLRQLYDRINQLIGEYAETEAADDPAIERVAVFFSGYPTRGYPG